jgi:Uma2 family endonuclease
MSTLDDQNSIGSDDPSPAVTEPFLYDGQRLDQPTFHELYLKTSERFRAELIDGVVHLRNGRVSSRHGQSHSALIGFLFQFSLDTPGTRAMGRVTVIFGPKSELEPDIMLLIGRDSGGRMQTNPEGILVGTAELVIEIGDDTLEIDLNAKKADYERAGANEYLVLDVPNRRFRWFVNRGGRFETLPRDEDGLYRSPTFPGLWLDPEAFLRDDGLAVMATLRRGLESPQHADFVERLRQNRSNRP